MLAANQGLPSVPGPANGCCCCNLSPTGKAAAVGLLAGGAQPLDVAVLLLMLCFCCFTGDAWACHWADARPVHSERLAVWGLGGGCSCGGSIQEGCGWDDVSTGGGGAGHAVSGCTWQHLNRFSIVALMCMNRRSGQLSGNGGKSNAHIARPV